VKSLLTSLIAGFVTGETRQAVRQTIRGLIFYTVAAIAAIIGLGFLVGAVFIAVSEHYGSLSTAIGFGAGFLLLALMIYLLHLVLRRTRAKSAKRRRNDELTAVAAAAAVAILPTLLKGRGALGLMAVPAALIAYAIYRENSRPPRDPPAD
jgi:MFS family permease